MQLETNIKFQFSEFQRTKTLNSNKFSGQRQFLGNKFPRWKNFFPQTAQVEEMPSQPLHMLLYIRPTDTCKHTCVCAHIGTYILEPYFFTFRISWLTRARVMLYIFSLALWNASFLPGSSNTKCLLCKNQPASSKFFPRILILSLTNPLASLMKMQMLYKFYEQIEIKGNPQFIHRHWMTRWPR